MKQRQKNPNQQNDGNQNKYGWKIMQVTSTTHSLSSLNNKKSRANQQIETEGIILLTITSTSIKHGKVIELMIQTTTSISAGINAL